MVQMKRRPLLLRGNSAASVIVGGNRKDGDASDDEPQSCQPAPRAVRFAERVEEHPPAEILSEQEAKCYYYNSEDMHRFEKDRAITAFMYLRKREKGYRWDDNVDSIRGIEEHAKGEPPRALLRQCHAQRVLQEQQRLKEEGLFIDVESLCEASAKSSAESRALAWQLGQEDACAGYRAPPSLLKKVRSRVNIWLERTGSQKRLQVED